MIKPLLSILVIVLSLSSCRSSFLQRRYTPGFFAEKNHSAEAVSKTGKSFQDVRRHVKNITATLEKIAKPATLPVVSAKTSDSTIISKKQIPCGDTLVFRDGRKVHCKVTVISESEIHYKQCNDTSILRKTLVSDVSHIVFKNGLLESFSKPASTTAKRNYDSKKTNEPTSKKKTSWIAVLGHVFILFASIGAMISAPLLGALFAGLAIFGIVVLVQDPETFHRHFYSFYKITGQIAAIIIGIGIAIFVIGLAILIASTI